VNAKILLQVFLGIFTGIMNLISEHLPIAGPDKRAGARMVVMLGELYAQIASAVGDGSVTREEMAVICKTGAKGFTDIGKELERGG
jgi:Mg2+/citrate symporter